MRQLLFEFPASTKILAKVGKLAADAGRSAGFGDGQIGDIELAVDEACTNTIIYGLRKDPNRTFNLLIQWEEGVIEILIHEAGEPFDMAAVRQPDLNAPLEDRSVGGLGIYFIREVMDEVEYRTNDEGVKTLRMLKRVGNKP